MQEREQAYQLTGEVYSRTCTEHLYFPTKCRRVLAWDPYLDYMVESSWSSNFDEFINNQDTRYEKTIPMNNITISYGMVYGRAR